MHYISQHFPMINDQIQIGVVCNFISRHKNNKFILYIIDFIIYYHFITNERRETKRVIAKMYEIELDIDCNFNTSECHRNQSLRANS